MFLSVKRSILFFLSFFSLFSLSAETCLLTTPRSGTHLFLNSCLHFFNQPFQTGVRTKGLDKLKDKINKENPSNLKKEMLRHFHTPEGIKKHKIAPEKNKLIYILRDFKENIINVPPRPSNDTAFISCFNNSRRQFRLYFNNLECFHSWSGEKLLIHYEDLVLRPLEVMQDFADFMGYEFNPTQEMIQTYEEEQQKILKIYLNEYRERKGKDSKRQVKFHQLKFSPAARERVDQIIENKYPTYWNHYLYLYQE